MTMTNYHKYYQSSKALVQSLSPEKLLELQKALTPKLTKYVPHSPTPKQTAFLLLPGREAFYGGAAGGGKSDALLMAALQYVDVPGYAALLLRRSFKDLSLPGALMDRADQWLRGTDARWDEQEKTWHFPSGASMTFGYLSTETDKYQYQSAEFQFIGFDELTQFTETQYRYLFSRLRRLEGSTVPLRMRAASNPGGTGGEWVYERFIGTGKDPARYFIPANLDDNPYLDHDAYVESLSELDPVTREQLLNGNWEIRESGGLFRREWFRIKAEAPSNLRKYRIWDFAATAPRPGKDPDYTVGMLMGELDGQFWILDIVRLRGTPENVELSVKQTADIDGIGVPIILEEESGASGKSFISHYRRNILKGYTVIASHPTKDKSLRAAPASSAAEAGNVFLLRGHWNLAFLEEAQLFPKGQHDDQIDTFSCGHNRLSLGLPKKEARSLTWVGGQRDYDD